MNIELTKNQALTLATMAIAADNPRTTAAPVLTQIKVVISAGKLTAYATDRFMAVKFTDDLQDLETPDTEFYLMPATAKFLKSNLAAKYYGGVIFSVEEREVTVTLTNGASFSEIAHDAKYPAIESLIDGWQPDTIHRTLAFRIEFLARLEKIKLDGEFADLWHLEPGANTYNTAKPGPMMARAAKSGRRLVAIVQPNLITEEN